MGKQYWWLAINQGSCAACFAALSLEQLEVVPRPQWIIGFPTREEQLKAQHLLLNAPMSEVIAAQKAWQKRSDVQIVTMKNPEPPTRGQTAWIAEQDTETNLRN